jgi:hypothetical protein
MEPTERDFRLLMPVAGLVLMVLGVLDGLTHTVGGVDWVAVAMSIGGFVLMIVSLYILFRPGGTSSAA